MEGNGELLLFFFDILTASDLVALVLAVHLAVALERPKLFKKNWEMIFLIFFATYFGMHWLPALHCHSW